MKYFFKKNQLQKTWFQACKEYSYANPCITYNIAECMQIHEERNL